MSTPADPGTALVTLAEVRTHMNYDDASNTADDAELMNFALAATEVAEEFGGLVRQQTLTEQHDGGKPTIVLREPCVSVTSVTEYLGHIAYPLTEEELGGSSFSQWGFTVDGQTITRRMQGFAAPFYAGRRNVVVSYVAGPQFIAQRVKLGVLMLIQDWWESSQQVRTGSLGGSFAGGDEMGPPSMTDRGYAVPAAIQDMLTPQPRISGFA